MSNQWFRLYSRIITDPKVEMLSFEDQRHFVWLMCLKNEGYLDESFASQDMFDRMVARKLGLQGEAFENAKRRLIEVGLIDNDWQPIRWNDLQFISDSDPTAKDRKRRQRERNKSMSRVTVTGVTENVTRTDTDTDTDTDIKTKSNDLVVELFDFWVTTLHHERSKLDDKRKKAIQKALNLKYTIDDLKAAIVGCSKTPFNMGQNDQKQIYDDVTLIFRDAAHIDRFIANAKLQTTPSQTNVAEFSRAARKVYG